MNTLPSVINYTRPELIPMNSTPVGYELRSDQTFDEWLADGDKLNLINKWKNFAIGDWLLQGANRFGEVCYQAIDEYGWGSYDKIKKLVWVARNVPAVNRNMRLTWTHHHHVAQLPPSEQVEWLQLAERQQLTSDELKQKIADSRPLKPLLQLPEVQPHTNTNGNGYHAAPADDPADVDDVPFGTLREVQEEQDDAEYIPTNAGGYIQREHVRECAKCHQVWAADLPYCPYCNITPEARVDYVQQQERTLRLAAANHVVSDDPNYDGDEWYTPVEYIEAARELMGGIDLDPASCTAAQETVKAETFYTKQDNGLTVPWFGCVWLNPPYSTPLIRYFVAKLIEEYEAGNITEAVILTNNSSDTAWFHDLLCRYPACFPRGRVQFWRPDHADFGARQGQTLFYLGENVQAFKRIFGRFGQVVGRL